MATDERFILRNKIGQYTIWYICGLEYYNVHDSDWVLGPTNSQRRKNAMQFCESKAKILAEILSNQVDEEGYSSQYEVVKL